MSTSATLPVGQEPASFALIAAQRYSDQLKRYLSRRIQRSQDVDDLAQQVYLKLLRVHASTDVEIPLRFVYGVASKVIADHWASAYRETAHFPSAGEAQDVCANLPSDALTDRPDEQLDLQQQLEVALQTVSPMHAAVVILMDRDEMSQEEVAEALGLSTHTVKKYATQARAQIRMQGRKPQ